MRIRLKQILLLSALLLTAVFSVAQSLDIVVEGPWIYYEGLIPGSGTQPVLVLMAPKVAGHYPATFSTGDGYPIGPGTYCVGFGPQCSALVQRNQQAQGRTYVPEKRLGVLPRIIWDPQAHQLKQSASAGTTYLILPLPDSYSNDGVYPVKFGSTFGKYAGVKQQSIGLQLHYLNGPKVITLSPCTSLDATTCTQPRYPDQENWGTLNITIKACGDPDEGADECDAHVRSAYHAMILFLDDTSLLGGKNANQDKGYVDLPPYDPACYATDPQKDGMPAMECKNGFDGGVALEELRKIIQQLSKISKTHHVAASQLFLPQLTELSNQLASRIPRFSQLNAAATYLDLSAKATFGLTANSRGVDDATEKAAGVSLPETDPIIVVAERESKLARVMYSPTSGKDCKVTQMLLQAP